MMKKLLCVLLVLTVLFSFAACGKEKNSKVTIYIPDAIEVFMGDGTKFASVTYVFEEGWQNKESFTATLSGDTDKLGGSGTTVYSDKKTTQEVGNGATMEVHYNAKGQQVLMINRYADGGHREVTYTYDSKGRLTSQEEKMYESAESEAVTTTANYTYTDTETGYTATQEMDGYTVVNTFDKNGNQLSQVVTMNGNEMSRTEGVYDEHGNMVSQISYSNGQKQMEMKYTWKAVEVSSEVAARLPQFRKGN